MFYIFRMLPISNIIVSSIIVLTAFNLFIILFFPFFHPFIWSFFFYSILILQLITCYNFGFLKKFKDFIHCNSVLKKMREF
jgi:hypothetical protein